MKLEPSSPRSVEACLHLGIDPADLRRIPLEVYLSRERVPDLAQLLYTAAEKLRQVSCALYSLRCHVHDPQATLLHRNATLC